MPDAPDLSSPRQVHVVAAGGAGMSAIATVLAQAGHTVTGSDAVDGPALRHLEAEGVRVQVGHDAAAVAGAELVVVSTAVADDNPEVVAARACGILVLSRRELLPGLAALQPFLSVAGTHGKTTTSSMLAVALTSAGLEPSFLVGAEVAALGASAGHQSGRYLVLEADESDATFLAGPRAGALVTNLEPDHLEFWGGWDALEAGFVEFLDGTDGPRVVCADDPGSAALEPLAGVPVTTYGTSPGATHRLVGLELGPAGSTFRLDGPAGGVPVALTVPGLHNARNAAGALALAVELGVDPAAAAAGLGAYTGVARRFEHRGEVQGITFVDDYAHLPTEVRAALAAGRSGGWDRVVAVFQPHRYSRTELLGAAFGPCFGDADV
ncbi:MAG: UDP-N-acetylmuramate--L-alanine ligase, partial [Actinomycetes bacterium]